MLDTSQQHGHSGLSGDGKKIKYRDLDGAPKSIIKAILIENDTTISYNIGFRPRIININSAGIGTQLNSNGVIGNILYQYKDNLGNLKIDYNTTNLFIIKDDVSLIDIKGNIIINNTGFSIEIIDSGSVWNNIQLILTIFE